MSEAQIAGNLHLKLTLVAAGLRAEMDEVEVKVNSQFRKVLVNACI